MRKVRPSAFAASDDEITIWKACARAKGWSYSRFMREAANRLKDEIVSETGRAVLLSDPSERVAANG